MAVLIRFIRVIRVPRSFRKGTHMAEYAAPLKDMQFVLKHVVGLDQVNTLAGWEEVTEDVVDAILEEAGKLASEVLSPRTTTRSFMRCGGLKTCMPRTRSGRSAASEIFVIERDVVFVARRGWASQTLERWGTALRVTST